MCPVKNCYVNTRGLMNKGPGDWEREDANGRFSEKSSEQNAKDQSARACSAALQGSPGVFACEDLCELIPLKNRTFPVRVR